MKAIIPSTGTLRAISETAKRGSFAAAAEYLGLTQGAVAQKVRQFEADLGFALFERQTRGLKPTQKCSEYLVRIDPALVEISEATNALATPAQSNLVRVSTTPTLASRWLIPRLSQFYLDYSDIVIAIDATDRLRQFTGPQAIDIALRWGGGSSDNECAHPLSASPNIAVASPSKIKDATRSIDHLNTQPLLNDSHRLWQKWSAHFKIKLPSVPLEFGQTNHVIDAALNGLGIALAPKILVQSLIDTHALIEVFPSVY
jgi:LysR family glycine cleavage system transcriptional activator